MSTDTGVTRRRDAVRNRERLVAAARRVFAEQGHDVPLEEVARAAQVSRTTLHRHFATREELAAQVYEDNVARIERFAADMRDRPDGLETLWDFVVGMQLEDNSLGRVLSGADITWFTGLSDRTGAAFAPLLESARAAGTVHQDITVVDVLATFHMAQAAIAENLARGRREQNERVRELLRRSLFTTASR